MASLHSPLPTRVLQHHGFAICNRAPSVLMAAASSAKHSGLAFSVRASGTPDNHQLFQSDPLVGEFVRYVYNTQQPWPLQGRSPSPFLPPNSVVRVQMDALMRNDWPEEDSGIRTAFMFSMPERAEEMMVTQVPNFLAAVTAWSTAEYISFNEFAALLKGPLYAPIINCSDWKVASQVRFNGVEGHTACQAVKVTPDVAGATSRRLYTFCLKKVRQGPYRACWMVVCVKIGDSANE